MRTFAVVVFIVLLCGCATAQPKPAALTVLGTDSADLPGLGPRMVILTDDEVPAPVGPIHARDEDCRNGSTSTWCPPAVADVTAVSTAEAETFTLLCGEGEARPALVTHTVKRQQHPRIIGYGRGAEVAQDLGGWRRALVLSGQCAKADHGAVRGRWLGAHSEHAGGLAAKTLSAAEAAPWSHAVTPEQWRSSWMTHFKRSEDLRMLQVGWDTAETTERLLVVFAGGTVVLSAPDGTAENELFEGQGWRWGLLRTRAGRQLFPIAPVR